MGLDLGRHLWLDAETGDQHKRGLGGTANQTSEAYGEGVGEIRTEMLASHCKAKALDP